MVKVITSVTIIAISIALIFKLFSFSRFIDINVSENEFISGQFRYQLLLLVLALVTLSFVYFLNGDVLAKFISLGDIRATANPVPVFGIKEESWLSLGLSLSFFITLITGIFIYFQVRGVEVGWGYIAPVMGWILLFSFTNSFSEEVIFRLGLAGSLYGVVSPSGLMLISAIVFGLVHYGGMPSGVIGVLMAGVLGWLLMKSVIETQGIFWAWFIHFLQDVVIFSGLVLMKNKANVTAVVN